MHLDNSQWDFIENHYPNYYACDKIALSNFIASFLNNDFYEHEYKAAKEKLIELIDFKSDTETLESFALQYMTELDNELYNIALKAKNNIQVK